MNQPQTRICRDCGDEFDPCGKVKGGYIDQCNNCAKDVPRFLGRQGVTNKDASITVIRTDLQKWGKIIKAENARGYGACLPIGSYEGTNNFEHKDEL